MAGRISANSSLWIVARRVDEPTLKKRVLFSDTQRVFAAFSCGFPQEITLIAIVPVDVVMVFEINTFF